MFFAPEVLAMLDLDEESWLTMKDEPRIEPSARPAGDSEILDPNPNKKKRATTPRIRNKAKIELLRREIEALEVELEALQRSKRMAELTLKHPTAPNDAVQLWKGIASRQSQERERAELRNAGLKKALAEQQFLTVSLAGVLNEWTRQPRPTTACSFHRC